MSRRVSSVVLLFALLVSCTPGAKLGGGPLPVASPTPTPAPPGATTAPLTFTFVMPTVAAMRARRPFLASANTQSLAIFIYAQGSQPSSTPTATVNVGATFAGCVTNSAQGQITCEVTVTAPLGNQELEIVAMSGPNGTGNNLGSVTQAVTVGSSNPTISLTLNGAPALIKLSLETPILALGTAGTSVLDVDAYDATGALIVAPGSFTSPLTVTSDSTAVTLSPTSVTTPGTKVTISYNGSSNAPYAVHLSASGGTIPSNLVIGATLLFEPSQSIAVFNFSEQNAAVATLATTAVNAPAQAFTFLTIPLTPYVYSPSPGAFAVLPNGGYAVAMYDYVSSCQILIYPGGSEQGTSALTVSATLEGCPIAAEPNNDLLVANLVGGNSELTEYSVSGTTLATTGRVLSLVGAQVPGSSINASHVAVNASGAIAITGSHGATSYALTYAAGASGAATPTATATLVSSAYGIAIAANGAVDVLTSHGVFAGYIITEYPAGLGSNVTVTANAPSGGTIVPVGVAVDASGEALALYDEITTNYLEAIDVWAPGANSAPLRTLSVTTAAGPGQYAGPIIVPSPAPPTSNTAITGDMFGYVANRTWTYLVTPGFGGSPYYVGIYADPNPVNGNVRFVGYQSSSSSSLFTAGTKIGTLDLTQLNGSYLAAAFASVSSGTNGVSGSVPGTPLLVPGSLAIGQSWNPLQNATIASAVGVTASAQVVATGTVAGIGACPSGSGASGATVQYSVTAGGTEAAMTPSLVSYVPGCGITSIQESGPTTNIVLQSVGSMPSLGQQDVPPGQPPVVAALHRLWQATFGVHPPSR